MPGFVIPGAGDVVDGAIPGPASNGDFLRAHRWRVVNINRPVAGGNQGIRSVGAAGLGIENLYVKEVKLPSLNFEIEQVLGGSIYYKVAKRAIWEDVVIKFYDTRFLHAAFKAWQEAIWTPESGISQANDYTGSVTIALTNELGQSIQEFTLRNAYVKKLDHAELSMTSSEIKLLIVTFSYDFADINPNIAT